MFFQPPPPPALPDPLEAPSGVPAIGQAAHIGPLFSMFFLLPSVLVAWAAYRHTKDDPLSGPHAKAALNFHLLWSPIIFVNYFVLFALFWRGIVAVLLFLVLVLAPVLICGLALCAIGVRRGMDALRAGSTDVRYPLTPQFIK